MKLYGKKFLRNSLQGSINARTETKDAILWDILPDQRLCRVKIQGSNQLITCGFSQNWEKKPVWLKPGNAVKIMHTSGIRGRIELVGHGYFIPSPIPGGEPLPPLAVGEDGVLSGLQVLAMDPAMMMVRITAGTYRIGGVVYYIGGYGGVEGPLTMGVPVVMEMGDAIPMGTLAAFGIPIDPAPATPGYFRIDLIVVGADGAVDYIKGTASANPVEPSVPASHVKCGSILVFYGATAIEQLWINRPFTPREPYILSMVIADDELIWGATPPPPYPELTTDIEVTIIDQYNMALAPTSGSWYVKMEFMYGNGKIDGVAPPGTVIKTTGDNHIHFTYERNHDAGDSSPMLKATLENIEAPVFVMGYIVLLDADGVPMGG